MSKRNENPQPHEQKSPARAAPGSQASTQSEAESAGELAKYEQLCDELKASVDDLAKLHEQRATFSAKLKALLTERAPLHGSLLDATARAQTDAIETDLHVNARDQSLRNGQLEALAPRIQKAETELQAKLPLAAATFETLRKYVCDSALESCRKVIDKLIDPSLPVADEHIDAIALAMPDYVKVSRLTIPAVSWTLSQSLSATPPEHWSSLVRPYTEAEWAAQRAETVKALVAVTNALVQAARALVAAATPYAEHCPQFKCEPEPVFVPAQADPVIVSWNEPIGTDLDAAKEMCASAGKPYPPETEQDKAILANWMANRKAPLTVQQFAIGT